MTLWNIDGSRDLSDPWTGFTQFTLLDEKAPNGYMWSGEFGPTVPKNPGVLLPDFSCAYPSVDRRWMFLVLERAGVQPFLRRFLRDVHKTIQFAMK